MRQIQPDLWETAEERPFPGLITHAYLLTRAEGNVLFYNTSHARELDAIEEHGGVGHQFLSHRDELGPSLQAIRERFGAALGGHRQEAEDFARYRRPDIVFDQRELLLDKIEVIPTPGHTPGSVCFLVHPDESEGGGDESEGEERGRRILFTGDTLFLAGDGGWQAGPGARVCGALVAGAVRRLLRTGSLEPPAFLWAGAAAIWRWR